MEKSPGEEKLQRIAKYFGNNMYSLSTRKSSYDFLRKFIMDNHNWDGGAPPDTDILVPKFQDRLKNISDKEFAFLLCHTGYIPEEYEHDSSEETIYTKLVEVLVQEWAIRIGFDQSELPKQKASKEDITIRDNDYVIVCDAKSYRLGRSQKAPNVKDALKEGDIAKWLSAYKDDPHSSLGGLVAFPSQHDWSSGSDFYLYLTKKDLPIVCLFYEHMAFMIIADIKKHNLISLYEQYGELFPKQLKKSDGNRDQYWSKLLDFLFGDYAEFNDFMGCANEIIKEKVFHTICAVEEHLSDIRQSIDEAIPTEATNEELREMLIDARFKLETLAVDRQLSCIRKFREHTDKYLSND